MSSKASVQPFFFVSGGGEDGLFKPYGVFQKNKADGRKKSGYPLPFDNYPAFTAFAGRVDSSMPFVPLLIPL